MVKRAHNKISWSAVEEALEQNTPAAILVAVLEAEKILQIMLKRRHLPGATMEGKLANIRGVFNNYEKLTAARVVYQKVINEPKIEIDLEEAEEVLSAYYQAVTDLTENPRTNLSLLQRLNLAVATYLPHPKKTLQILIFSIITFFIIVALLDRTPVGQTLVKGVLAVTNFLVSWTMLLVLIIAVVIAIVIITIYYLEKRKRNSIRLKE